jgi:hypothetical protein
MLESMGMSKPAGKTLTQDQVLLIAKALGDRRRYEILKRPGECRGFAILSSQLKPHN